MFKAVIFDLDGVIVSTDELHFQAWSKMTNEYGLYFNRFINNQLRGVSRRESLDIILKENSKRYSEELIMEMLTMKNNIYVDLLDSITENDILPGVKELLLHLKDKDYKIAIGSSSRNAKKILHKIGLYNWFDCISDGTNIKKSKPDPEVFLYAANKLGFTPNECIVVEDALSGIEAAKRADMFAVAVGDAKKSNLKDIDIEDIYHIL